MTEFLSSPIALARLRRIAAAAACLAALSLQVQGASAADSAFVPLLSDQAAPRPEILQRLPAGAADLLFAGEAAGHEWPVFVPGSMVTSPTTLRLALDSSVSSLPERSHLEVAVNDRVLVDTTLAALGGSTTLAVPVPVGLLEQGYNGVKVRVTQHHRVDCSVKATYELWTQIDGAKSGLARPAPAVAAEVVSDDLDDLARIPVGPSGATSLRLVVRDASDEAAITRGMKVVEAVVLAGHVRRPVVEVVEQAPAVGGDGLSIFVGTHTELARLGSPAHGGVGNFGKLTLGASGAEGSYVVSAGDERALDEKIKALLAAAASSAPKGTESGLRALANVEGRVVEDGARLTFAELGAGTEGFSGRLYRDAFRLRLPADFFSADYGKASLVLDGVAADGLLPGNRMTVWVNGANVAGVLVKQGNSGALARRTIGLPLEVFRPGVNEVRLEAETSVAADIGCEAASTDDRTRLSIAGTSEIVFPRLARAVSLPEISTVFAGGLDPGRESPVYLASAETAIVNAAATLVASIVSTSRTPYPAAFRLGAPANPKEGLLVGALGDLPTAVSGEIRAATSVRAVAGQAPESGGVLWVRAAMDRVLGVLRESGLLEGAAGDRSGLAVPEKGLVVLQSATARSASSWQVVRSLSGVDGSWTAFAAPTDGSLEAAVAKLSAEDGFGSLSGGVSVFDTGTGVVRAVEPESHVYAQTRALTPGNMHLFVAGLFSQSTPAYVAVLMIGCLLLGWLTHLVVRRFGVKR